MINFIYDILTLGKVILQSKGCSRREPRHHKSIVVMGNGPSLGKVISEQRDILMSMDRMAVNFAANAAEFTDIKPQYYILADPHFFTGGGTDQNVSRLWDRLRAVDWEMTMWLPTRYRREAEKAISGLGDNVRVKWFNLTPSERGGALTRRLIDAGLAMPRPRNVLIPAIMCAMREGYDEIILTGADHSWLQSLWVDDENRVVSVQPHFYKDKKDELERVASVYAGYHLHDILGSMVVAFRSYFEIADYARRRGVSILNATPGSFIDAFERIDFSQKQPR
ncbi:MAG: hypothetical protein K2H86_09275 [Muribaculaceae bacterium]|nr:hypothetical protein [Muribaculaceae bacterium]